MRGGRKEGIHGGWARLDSVRCVLLRRGIIVKEHQVAIVVVIKEGLERRVRSGSGVLHVGARGLVSASQRCLGDGMRKEHAGHVLLLLRGRRRRPGGGWQSAMVLRCCCPSCGSRGVATGDALSQNGRN